jgi:hypothetical protein
MKIHEEIPKIMSEIGSIGKTHKNSGQNYKYRAVDDVMAVINPILSKHGIFIFPDVTELNCNQVHIGAKNTPMIHVWSKIKYHFVADDGSEIVACVIGEGTDTGDKAANKAMATAYKYAVTQTFSIPTDEPKDPEMDNPNLGTNNNFNDEDGVF